MSLICPTCGQPNLAEEAMRQQLNAYNLAGHIGQTLGILQMNTYYGASDGIREIKRPKPDVKKALTLNKRLLT